MLGFVIEDILWPPLFSLPLKCRLPSVVRSGRSMPAALWAVSGGCQHGRLWAGRGTARETTSEQGQPPQPPWKQQPGIASIRGPCTVPLLSNAPSPPTFVSRLEQTSGALLYLHGFGSFVVSQQFGASQHGTHQHSALCLAGHQHQMWRRAEEHYPTSEPHTGSLALDLAFPEWRLSRHPGPLSPLPLCPWAGDAAAELGSLLHGPEAEDILQTKDSASATLSPCHDHWDTHLLVLLLQAWADTEAVPLWHSSPHPHHHPHYRTGPILRLVWG